MVFFLFICIYLILHELNRLYFFFFIFYHFVKNFAIYYDYLMEYLILVLN